MDKVSPSVLLQMQDTVGGILNGTYDGFLDSISKAVRTREETLAEIKALTLTIGDRVRLVKVRPKYIEGTEEISKKIKRGKFGIHVDQPCDRRINKFLNDEGTLSAKASILEPV